ncbi:hypothetical protein Tco_0418165 [Tanacetum coccineum]
MMTYPCYWFCEQVGLASDLRSINDVLIPLLWSDSRRGEGVDEMYMALMSYGHEFNTDASGLLFLDRLPRGGVECFNLIAYVPLIGMFALFDHSGSRWLWSLNSSNEYIVASVRALVDANTLVVDTTATRWNRNIGLASMSTRLYALFVVKMWKLSITFSSLARWLRIYRRCWLNGGVETDITQRTKNKAKNDKTKHGLEMCEKTKPIVNQAKNSTEKSKLKSTPTRVKVNSEKPKQKI